MNILAPMTVSLNARIRLLMPARPRERRDTYGHFHFLVQKSNGPNGDDDSFHRGMTYLQQCQKLYNGAEK